MQTHALSLAFVASASVIGLVLLARPQLTAWLRHSDLSARQAAHTQPTLRLGGVGIVFALWSVCLLLGRGEPFFLAMMLASLPLVLVGSLEDVGIHQSPARRLLAAGLSSALLILLEGVTIERVDIPFVNPLFAFSPVAIAFTLFASAGLIHAFNLIDGLNGLSSAVAISSTVALVLVGERAGILSLDLPAYALIGAVAGFVVFNYPFGKIFLGDAGAYLVGFVLAWLSIFLMALAPTSSPWAILLIFFWPIADTLLAMWRRFRNQVPLGQPDRLHVHHVIMRSIEIVVLRRRHRALVNPLTTLVMLPFMIAPLMVGVAFWDDSHKAASAFFIFGALFVLSYVWLVRSARTRR